ncbi:hypothetical protein HK101_004297, partial [Irineochytrium annulatum]
MDLAEIWDEPIPGVDVVVQEGNMGKLCAILRMEEGPYSGLTLHLVVEVPETYPMEPPMIRVDPPEFRHPNVFDGWICLDMLEAHTAGVSYVGGYTPAYSLSSIFMQLISFFSSEVVEQSNGKRSSVTPRKSGPAGTGHEKKPGFHAAARTSLSLVSCKECKYDGRVMNLGEICESPVADKVQRIQGVAAAAAMEEEEGDLPPIHLLDGLPEVWMVIADLLTDQRDVIRLKLAFKPFRRICSGNGILARRNVKCFYLRTPFDPSHADTILGIGVNLTFKSKLPVDWDREARASIPNINQVTLAAPSEFDILSYDAFRNHDVRKSIWGVPFTHFLPLAINRRHFNCALPYIKDSLCVMAGVSKRASGGFNPLIVLEVLPRLMNDLVVCFSRFQPTPDNPSGISRASEKALNGYCALLHLLLELSLRFPIIEQHATAQLRRFHSNPSACNKSDLPDLGRFLILLSLTGDPALTWSTISKPFLKEMFTRNVVFSLDSRHGNKPHLLHLDPGDADIRLRETFATSGTSARLLLFQIYFLRSVARPPGMSPADVARGLAERHGHASDETLKALAAEYRSITLISDHAVFLRKALHDTGHAMPSKEEFAQVLRDAVVASAKKEYHVSPFSGKMAYYLRRVAEEQAE